LPRLQRTPTLVPIAWDSFEDKTTGHEAGAGDYPVKPFVLDEFRRRCRPP
jgi:DNA-binding response OmpR family regulator